MTPEQYKHHTRKQTYWFLFLCLLAITAPIWLVGDWIAGWFRKRPDGC